MAKIKLNPFAKNILAKIIAAMERRDNVLLEKFFPNGIVFRPKEGRAVIINTGAAFSEFILTQKGYCFLHEIFPGTTWEREVDKWWVVPITREKTSWVEILKMFHHFDETNSNGNEKPVTNSPLSSLVSITNTKDSLDLDTFAENINKKINLGIQTDAYLEEFGVLFFQNSTGEKRIGFRNIEFRQFKDGKIIDRSTGYDSGHNYDNTASPYYVTAYFPYAFEVTDAEDKNLIPTDTQLVVRARCINPYFAHVISGDPFNTFTSIVHSVCQDTIRTIAMHTVLGTDKTSDDNALSTLSEEIRKALHEPKNFFGFAIKDVEILQVAIGGPNAEKLRSASTSIYTAQQDQQERVIKAETTAIETEKGADGEAKKIEKLAKAKAAAIIQEAEAVAKALSITEPAKAEQLNNLLQQVSNGGANPNLFLAIEGLVKAFAKK